MLLHRRHRPLACGRSGRLRRLSLRRRSTGRSEEGGFSGGTSAAPGDTRAARPWCPSDRRPTGRRPVTPARRTGLRGSRQTAPIRRAAILPWSVRSPSGSATTAHPADSARWPVPGPAPLPDHCCRSSHRRLLRQPQVHPHGNPGQIPPAEMLPRLERTATGGRGRYGPPVIPALHLIATVAQGSRARVGSTGCATRTDHRASPGLGEERGWIVFLDVQIGHSTWPTSCRTCEVSRAPTSTWRSTPSSP